MRRASFRFLLVLALVCAATVGRADPGRNVEDLMRKSGLHKQMAQFQDQFRAGTAQLKAQVVASGGPELSDEMVAWIASMGERAYAPGRMREIAARELAAALAPEDEVKVLEWLDSAPGRRLTVMEENATDINGPEALNSAMKAVEKASAGRVALITRFVDAIDAGGFQATMTINMLTALGAGVAAVTTTLDPSTVKSTREKMESMRPQLAAQLRAIAIPVYVHVYRTATDEDLERYVAFNESGLGKRYNEASVKAVDGALTRATLDFGRLLATESRKGRQKL